MRFLCIDDGVPEETVRLLREASDARGIELVQLPAPGFDYASRLDTGDAMYRPAVSLAAIRVEQFLMAPGVATFYPRPEDVYFGATAFPFLFERGGLPIATTVLCASAERALLRALVGRLGGLPIVMKVLGRAGGIGVMRIDSWAGVFSLVDFVLAEGKQPVLCRYVADAVHWRLIVVGDRVVAAYRNRVEADDFRTSASVDPSDYMVSVRPEMAAAAMGAVRVLRREHGGVDLLEDGSGAVFVLEANFPCYFATAQLTAGIDVAGAMVDHLIAKARRLADAG